MLSDLSSKKMRIQWAVKAIYVEDDTGEQQSSQEPRW